jgi:hypothetical protein
MPEAAVDVDRHSGGAEDNVRSRSDAPNRRDIHAIAESAAMQLAPELELRPRISAPDLGHALGERVVERSRPRHERPETTSPEARTGHGAS